MLPIGNSENRRVKVYAFYTLLEREGMNDDEMFTKTRLGCIFLNISFIALKPILDLCYV